MRFYGVGISLFFLFVCLSCSVKEKAIPLNLLNDYPLDSITAIKAANQLRNSGDFKNADSAYQAIQKNSNEAIYKEFASLNQLLCKLVADDTLYFDTLIYSKKFKGIASLLNGILLTRNDRSGMDSLHKAWRTFRSERLENSFYYLMTIEQLGLAHRQNVVFTDSALSYFKSAYDLIASNNQLNYHRSRLLMRLAKIHQINRDELTAIGLLDEALSLDTTLSFRLDALLMKSSMLRFLKQFEDSRVVREKVLKLSTSAKDSIRIIFALAEEAMLSIATNNNEEFNKNIYEISNLAANVKGGEIILERLLARYSYSQEDYLSTLIHSKKALNSLLKQSIPESTIIFNLLFMICDSHLKLGDFDQARYYAYAQLLYPEQVPLNYSNKEALRSEVSRGSYNYVIYDFLGALNIKEFEVTHKKSSLLQAYRIYSMVDSLMESQVRSTEEESQLTSLQMGHIAYANAINTCFLLYSLDSDVKWVESAHLFMEKSKSLSGHRDFLKHSKYYFPNVPQAIRKQEMDLRVKISNLRRQGLDKNDLALRDGLQEQDEFLVKLKKIYPDYFTAKYPSQIKTAESICVISKEQQKSIINYHLTDQKIFVVQYDSIPTLKAISKPIGLNDSIWKFRNILSTPDNRSLQSFKRLSFWLYQILISPLKIRNVQLDILREGNLNYLPFEALISDTTGNFKTAKYLVNNHSIIYRSSLKGDLTFENKPIKKILAYADNLPNDKLPKLNGSLIELKILADIFNQSQMIRRVGSKASRSSFIQDIERDVDLIHIGLHASSNANNRLDNQILFKSRNSIDTLFGFEIVPKFLSSHTVVLTSCESGYGFIAPGEGTYTLGNAFLRTGVSNVISSLWSLPDYSSPILCETFYKKLAAGINPSKALQAAKLNYIKNADEYTSTPFYWATLVLETL